MTLTILGVVVGTLGPGPLEHRRPRPRPAPAVGLARLRHLGRRRRTGRPPAPGRLLASHQAGGRQRDHRRLKDAARALSPKRAAPAGRPGPGRPGPGARARASRRRSSRRRCARRPRRGRTPGRSRSPRRRGPSAAIDPSTAPSAHISRPVGEGHQGHRPEAGPPVPPAVGEGAPARPAAGRRCRRRWRRARRSGRSTRPGAPPSASTSRPVSSATAARPVAAARARAFSRALSTRVSPVSSTSATSAGRGNRSTFPAGPRMSAISRGLVGVGRGQHQTEAARRPRSAAHRGGRRVGQDGRLLGRPGLAMPASARASSSSSSPRREGQALGRALHLDEPARPGHDHVHVDLGPRVLLVGEVEHGHAVDDPHRDGGHRVGQRVPAQLAPRACIRVKASWRAT